MVRDKTLDIASLMTTSGVQFGTSGARGLVSAMSDEVCYAYTAAFLQHLKTAPPPLNLSLEFSVAIAGDLRASSPRILCAIAAAIRDQGGQVIHCGYIPSPAVVYFGMQQRIPSIMVTGSHIPDDRNGIKFNSPQGEILKQDEMSIRAQTVKIPAHVFDQQGMFIDPTGNHALPSISDRAYKLYVERYLSFFPKNCLSGKVIALYEHSSVGRDIFYTILEGLGAEIIRLARSDQFISVDTEAIRPEDIKYARQWAKEHRFDAIISADGDADRPLIGDEKGEWIRGDIAGILTADYLGADYVATPVSSNTAVEKCGKFTHVARTRIGSPYVIEAMQQANPQSTIIGYEANGGFLLGSSIERNARTLQVLPTRDAILVPLTILLLASEKKLTLSQLVNTLPARYTASDRVKAFPTEKSQSILASFLNQENLGHAKINAVFGELFGSVAHTDATDGLRITFENNEVVHLRPSGNAPEFRCYNEASSVERAQIMNRICINLIESWK